MVLLVVLVLAMLALVAATAMVLLIVRLVRWLLAVGVRVALAGSGAILSGLAASVLATAFGLDPGTVGVLVGLALLPVCAILIGRLWPMVLDHRRLPDRAVPHGPWTIDAAPGIFAPPPPPPAPPSLHPALDAAWEAAVALVPMGARRIAAQRSACEALLAYAAADSLDWSITDWARLVETRVPELVAAAVAVDRVDRRAGAAAALLDDLDAIAAEARARLDAAAQTDASSAEAAKRHFETVRAYVASRTRAG